jgi:hypothetical protein
MAHINLFAYACTFSARAGFRSREHRPLDPPVAKATIEASNVDHLEAAMGQLTAQVKRDYPRSFFITAAMARGERAIRGFNSRTWLVEVDRDTPSA